MYAVLRACVETDLLHLLCASTQESEQEHNDQCDGFRQFGHNDFAGADYTVRAYCNFMVCFCLQTRDMLRTCFLHVTACIAET